MSRVIKSRDIYLTVGSEGRQIEQFQIIEGDNKTSRTDKVLIRNDNMRLFKRDLNFARSMVPDLIDNVGLAVPVKRHHIALRAECENILFYHNNYPFPTARTVDISIPLKGEV